MRARNKNRKHNINAQKIINIESFSINNHKNPRHARGFLYLRVPRVWTSEARTNTMRMYGTHKTPPRGHGVPKNACIFGESGAMRYRPLCDQ